MSHQKIFVKIFVVFFFIISSEAKVFNCQFEKNLFLGSQGNDVLCLQQYLLENKLFKGKITGIYDFNTKRAVKAWQESNKIYPANGNFETSSRDFLNSFFLINQFFQDLAKIKIDFDEKNGIKDVETYFKTVFIDILPNVNSTTFIRLFDSNEPFSLVYLVNQTINGQNNTSREIIKQKNQIFYNFFKHRLQRLQELKVSSQLKNFHLALLLGDFFSLDLSEKFNNYLDNKISKAEFQHQLKNFEFKINFIKKFYVDTFYKEQIGKVEGRFLVSITKIFFENKIWQNVFLKQAEAFDKFTPDKFTPFGGKIEKIIICPCSAGKLVYVGFPRRALLFISASFEATDFVFMWKNLYTIGVWLLGIHLPNIIPCFQFVQFGCVSSFWGNQIFMVGTSLTP